MSNIELILNCLLFYVNSKHCLRNKSFKKLSKPPPYQWNLHSKIQHVRAQLIQKANKGQLEICIRREQLLNDSMVIINNLDDDMLKQTLYIKFEGENGLDFGGMSRDWFLSLSEEIINEKYGFFKKVGYQYYINPASDQIQNYVEFFKFVGKVIGMAVYHGKLIHSNFILPFYKQIFSEKLEFNDIYYIDPQIWSSLVHIRDQTITEDMFLTFSVVVYLNCEKKEKYISMNLKPNGSEILVTEQNKLEYLDLLINYYLNYANKQIEAIKEGINAFVPLNILKQYFDIEELEKILGGISEIDVNDMIHNTEYKGGYTASSKTVKWFWEIVRKMSQDDLKLLLKFVTGTNKLPIGGFEKLYGSNELQKFTINRVVKKGLPTSHSCFNRLDLPEYNKKKDLRKHIYYAIRNSEGFDIE